LLIEPGKGTYGLQIFLKGTGFAPNSQVQIEAFGQTIAPQSNSAGEFLVIAYAPTDQAKFKPGSFTLTARDAAGNSADANFTLEELASPISPGQIGAPDARPAVSSPAAPAGQAPPAGGRSTGLLVGAVVAGIVLLAVLVFAVSFLSTRHREKASQPAGSRQAPSAASRLPRVTVAGKPSGGESPDEKTPASDETSETTLVMPSLPKLSARPTLQVVGGEGNGTVYPLDRKTTVIGRGEDCDIVINHPMVSRHHARIVRVGPSYYIHDLQSTNSTMVNGKRIDQHVLQPEDEIQIGVTLLLFQQPQAE
jgi:pSer/pThr/pTyr-binding forkhead associated (FHA) protein